MKFVENTESISSTDTAQTQALTGQILQELGKIKSEDTEKILQLQKRDGLRFGEAAQKLGLISEIDIQQVLSNQFEYPYLQPEQNGYSSDLVVAYQPFSEQAESIRAIRGQLMLNGLSTSHRSLAIAGINLDCGSNVLTANLAILFSQLGKRTLLVDSNLRHPSQHQIFNLQNKQGLSDILAKRAELSNVAATPEPFANLTILSAGTQPPNPSELLSRSTFKETDKYFTEQYDVVLYDTSEIATSSDTFLIAAHTGGILLVVHKNKTRFNEIQAVNEQMTSNGLNIIGTVLIDL